MGLQNDSETIKLPQDLENKISKIRASTAISEQEAIDLKNANLILKDDISKLTAQEKELKDKIINLELDVNKKEIQLANLCNNCGDKLEELEKTRKEYLNLSVKIDEKQAKQGKTDKANEKKEKELADKEKEILQREIDISNAESDHAIKVNKLADFISKL